jgi:hypothetical protein
MNRRTARQRTRASTRLRSWPRRWTSSATGTGNLRDRLYEAAYYVLRVQPDEIPDELRHVLVGVKDDLHFAAQPKRDEGGLVDALKITGDEDAKAVAHRILELYRELWIRLMR